MRNRVAIGESELRVVLCERVSAERRAFAHRARYRLIWMSRGLKIEQKREGRGRAGRDGSTQIARQIASKVKETGFWVETITEEETASFWKDGAGVCCMEHILVGLQVGSRVGWSSNA